MGNFFTNRFKRIDKTLFVCSLFLAVFGFFWVWSATVSLSSARFVAVQGLSLVIGLVAMIVVANIDYGIYKKFSLIIFALGITLLVLTKFIGEGAEETGTQGWIRFAGIGIQPAEVVKIMLIVTISSHIAKTGDNINKPISLLLLIAHFALPTALVLAQPDIGMAIVYAVIFAGILFAAGLSFKYILTSLLAVGIAIPVCWSFVPEGSYIRGRVLTFLDPTLDPLGSGYNVMQSKTAIGSGQIFGNGYMQGEYNMLDLLPAKQTDFIIGVIGEEGGFICSMIVILLLLILVLRCFYIASKAYDKMGSSIAVGVGVMFLFHFFENMGMCVGLTPVTGIPLPFLSYGGSSLVTNFVAIALVMNVRAKRKQFVLTYEDYTYDNEYDDEY